MAPRVGVLEISQKMYSLKNMKFGAILFFMIVPLEVNIKWQQCSHGVAGIEVQPNCTTMNYSLVHIKVCHTICWTILFYLFIYSCGKISFLHILFEKDNTT